MIELSEKAAELNLQPGEQLQISILRNRNQTARLEELRPALTPHERAIGFRAWADSHPNDTPILSDESISREAIYGERG